jgi:para-aminobenzoate synthetase
MRTDRLATTIVVVSDRHLGPGVATVVAEIQRHMAARPTRPVLVAIDGGSGSGKSTLAVAVAAELNAVIVPSDDFFAAEITDAEWEALGPDERAAAAIDWRRLRTEALEPLLAGRPASWHPFDFEAGTRPDGTYPMSIELVTREPAPVIVLEGAYSSRPELADLIELAVLVDIPVAERHRRLVEREEETFRDAWHARWDGAEDYYFTQVRPASSFDLVVTKDANGASPA